MDRDEGAAVGGESVSVTGPWGGKGPHGGDIAWALFPFLGIGAFTLGFPVWFIKVAWILIVTLVVLTLLPNQVETAGEYLKQHWLKCLAAGFVTLIDSFLLGAVLCCTIVAPIALLIGYKVAKYFGLAVLFLVVGRALGRAMAHRELGPFAALLVVGLASTWEPELIEAMTGVIRTQMRALGAHHSLAPVLDLARVRADFPILSQPQARGRPLVFLDSGASAQPTTESVTAGVLRDSPVPIIPPRPSEAP